MKLTLEERFWAKVDKTETCWLWTGGVQSAGYGTIGTTGKDRELVHRLSYRLANGPIPDGMELDHICRVRRCVNPAHLRAVNRSQNNQNRSTKGRGKSGVRGVFWHAPTGTWTARVHHNYRSTSLGYYKTVEEAQAAVVAARLSIYTHNDADRERTSA